MPEDQLRVAVWQSERAAALQKNSRLVQQFLAESRNNLAWHLAIVAPPDRRKPEEAIALARQAVDAVPDTANFWNTLGAAESAAGHWQQSREALEKSMSLTSGGREADWWLLALSLDRLGDPTAAESWRRRAAEAARLNTNPNPSILAVRLEYERVTGSR
jgi:uncharacterized protein HemY